MAGHFSRRRARQRLMAEHQAGLAPFGPNLAAQPAGGMGIMVAGDPDEIRRLRHDRQQGARFAIQPFGGLSIVKGIAQRHDTAGPPPARTAWRMRSRVAWVS